MTKGFENARETCEERWRDEIAAHLLGALDESEAAALEAHLDQCPRCAETARWLQPAVDLLPASVPQLDPPPRLRENLMATVRAEADSAAGAESSPPVGARVRAWFDGLLLKPAVAAVAVALLISAGVVGYELRGGDSTETTAARTVEVAPTTPRLDATGSLELHGDRGVIRLVGLPELPGDEVYQAWVRTGERIAPSAVFVPDNAGNSSAELGEGLDGADEVMITREPAGGSQTPHPPVILSAALS